MSESPSLDLPVIESQLKGKTLQVYWYLLSQSNLVSIGVRKVQRTLGFSSPSIAAYHLEKLASLGLVEKSMIGEYYLTKEVKVGLLRLFTRMGRFLVPRYLFYSVLFTTMLIIYIIIYGHSGGIHNIIALIFGFSACVILWFETIRLWKEKPF